MSDPQMSVTESETILHIDGEPVDVPGLSLANLMKRVFQVCNVQILIMIDDNTDEDGDDAIGVSVRDPDAFAEWLAEGIAVAVGEMVMVVKQGQEEAESVERTATASTGAGVEPGE